MKTWETMTIQEKIAYLEALPKSKSVDIHLQELKAQLSNQ